MGPLVPFIPAIAAGIGAVSSVVSGVQANRRAGSQARAQEEQGRALAAEEGRIADSAAATQRARFFASGAAAGGVGTAPSRLVAETLAQGQRNIRARLLEGSTAAGATRGRGRQALASGLGGGISGVAETFKGLETAGFFK